MSSFRLLGFGNCTISDKKQAAHCSYVGKESFNRRKNKITYLLRSERVSAAADGRGSPPACDDYSCWAFAFQSFFCSFANMPHMFVLHDVFSVTWDQGLFT
uniref:Protein MEI2-like 2 n=1 Tax=Rhizophora mucronata TaxID=61149 RepID=A0A2P2N387_RHIMU